MAKLPTKEELGKPSSQGRTGVVSIGVPSMAGAFGTGAGLRGLADGIGDLGQGIMAFAAQKREENNATDVLNADAMFNKSKLELHRSITNDPVNFSTAGQRYTDGIHKNALPTAASVIRDKDTRAKWVAKRQADADDGLYQTYEWADKIDRENKITSIENSLDADAQITKDPYQSNRAKLAARDHTDNALKYGVESGLLSKEKALQLSNKYKRDTQKEMAVALMEVNPKGVTKIVNGVQAFEDLAQQESGGSYGEMEHNGLGFAGKYQFGGQRAQELGVWTPARGYTWNNKSRGGKAKWRGTFNIPGPANDPNKFANVRTIDDFLRNADAQEAVFALHIQKIDEEIAERGLDKYIGSTIRGIPVTKEGLYWAIHIRGANGVAADFKDGSFQTDINGESALTYLAKGAKASLLADMDTADRAVIGDKAQKEVVMQDTLTGIKNGELNAQDVATIVASNGLDFYQASRLDSQLGLRAKEELRIRQAAQFADTSWIPDPTSTEAKDAMDAAYLAPNEQGLTGHQRLLARDQSFFDNTIIPMVTNKRMISPRLEGTISAMLSSKDPNMMAFALRNLEALQQASPKAFQDAMNPKSIGLLQRYRYRSDLENATPEQIAEALISEEADTTKAEARANKAKEGESIGKEMLPYLHGLYGNEWWADTVTSWPRRMRGAGLVWGPDLPEGQDRNLMEQKFLQLFSEAYAHTGGDKTAALKLVMPVLKKEFNTSKANDDQIMRLPPESFSPDVAGDAWIKPQMEARLAPLGVPNARLQADDRTDVEIANGKQPTWQVMVPGGGSAQSQVDPSIKDTGEGWVPLTDPEDGSLIRLFLNPTASKSDLNWLQMEMQGQGVAPQADASSVMDQITDVASSALDAINPISTAQAEEAPQGNVNLFAMPGDQLGGDGRYLKTKPPEEEGEDISAGDLLTSEYWLKVAQNAPQSFVDTVEGTADFVGDPVGTLGGFAAMMATDEEFRNDVIEHYTNYLSVGGNAKNFQKDPAGTLFALGGAMGWFAKAGKAGKLGGKRFGKPGKDGSAPSKIASIKQQEEGFGVGYDTIRDSGVYFKKDFIDGLGDRLREIAVERGFDPTDRGGADIRKVLKKMSNPTEPWTFKEVQKLSQDLNEAGIIAGKAGRETLQGTAAAMRAEVRKFLGGIADAKGEGMFHTGDITPERAAEMLDISNKGWRQTEVAQSLELMLRQSDIESSYVSIGAGNRANQLRKRVKQTLLEDAKYGTTGLKPFEIQILDKINKGTLADWALKGVVQSSGPYIGAIAGQMLDMGVVGTAAGVAVGQGIRRGAQAALDRRAVTAMTRFLDAVKADGSARLQELVGKRAYDKFINASAGNSKAVRTWQASIGTKSFGAASVALAVSLSRNEEEARRYLQKLLDIEKELAKTKPPKAEE